MNISRGREINYRDLGLDELVREALEMSGSKQRFLGIVTGYDQTGTTMFIRSDGKTYLALRDPRNPLKPSTRVTFRKDQLRAKDVESMELEDEPDHEDGHSEIGADNNEH